MNNYTARIEIILSVKSFAELQRTNTDFKLQLQGKMRQVAMHYNGQNAIATITRLTTQSNADSHKVNYIANLSFSTPVIVTQAGLQTRLNNVMNPMDAMAKVTQFKIIGQKQVANTTENTGGFTVAPQAKSFAGLLVAGLVVWYLFKDE